MIDCFKTYSVQNSINLMITVILEDNIIENNAQMNVLSSKFEYLSFTNSL